ncbi:hypothetical protein [Streptomyces sp. NPDC059894]|uniref:hypothetical protein n=1 Tax=unclassified Streptomyces TaxID=2593676 RepID=UPI0036571A8B
MTAGWCSRTVRAAVFAAVCVLLAALGHVMMSGGSVPAGALAAGAAVTGAAGWCLADRERGLPLIVTVVVAAQTALHTAFSLAQPTATGTTGPAAGGMDSMDMDPMDMGSMSMESMGSMHLTHSLHSAGPMHFAGSTPAARSMDVPDAMDLGHAGTGGFMGGSSSFGMLAAHLLAALLCGLWLAHGEKAAFRILRAVAGWLAAPLRVPLAPPAVQDRPRPRPRRPRSDRAPGLLPLVHAITSRGPPVGTAVA